MMLYDTTTYCVLAPTGNGPQVPSVHTPRSENISLLVATLEIELSLTTPLSQYLMRSKCSALLPVESLRVLPSTPSWLPAKKTPCGPAVPELQLILSMVESTRKI